MLSRSLHATDKKVIVGNPRPLHFDRIALKSPVNNPVFIEPDVDSKTRIDTRACRIIVKM